MAVPATSAAKRAAAPVDAELPSGFDHVREKPLRRFLAYWLSLREGAAVPRRAALDPVDIPWALPFIWLCDHTATHGYRYRLAGEAINEVYGRNLAGLTLAQLIRPDGYALVRARYDAAVEGPAVVHSAGRVYARSDRIYIGERLILPLSTDGRRVDQVVGMTVCDRDRLEGDRPFKLDDVVTTVTPLP